MTVGILAHDHERARDAILEAFALNEGQYANSTIEPSRPRASISLSSVQQPAGIAALPSSVTVPQGATSAAFIVTTFKCRPGSATISATYAGVMKSASLTATTKPDVVAIQRARYQIRRRTLTVEASSTDWNATLDAYIWLDGQVGSHIGRLTSLPSGSHDGQFSWPVDPTAIVVTSSSCGSATVTDHR